jgi:hypothetical protein
MIMIFIHLIYRFRYVIIVGLKSASHENNSQVDTKLTT